MRVENYKQLKKNQLSS